MIIAHPNDNRGLLYHLVNLLGQTVHAYRDLDAAVAAMEGDQRLCIELVGKGRWLTGAPTPVTMTLGEMEKLDPNIFASPARTAKPRRLTHDQILNLGSSLFLAEHESLEEYDLHLAKVLQDAIFGPEKP
jgi:hypothetical protein